MYVTDVYYAIEHDYKAQLKAFYEEYKDFVKKDNREPKDYDTWISDHIQRLKENRVQGIKEIIKSYVELEGDNYAFIRHEDWTAFMRDLEDIIPPNSRTAYNNFGSGFEVHFDVDSGIGINLDEVFGFWMKPKEIEEYYEKVVEPYRCM